MDEAAASLVNLSISTSGPQAPQCRIPFRAGWERNLELSSSEFTWGPKNQGGWCWCWVILLTILQLFATPWTAAHQASLFLTLSWSLLKLMFIDLVIPSNHLIFYSPLLLLPWIFPRVRVFFNELDLCIRWPKYWSFSFSISPSNQYSGLMSFRIDWFDLLPAKGLSRVFSSTTIRRHQSFRLSLFYSSALTSLHDYWKNHSFDYTDLCLKNNVSTF